MRVYRSALTVRVVARWLGQPTTGRTNSVLVLAGAGLVTACWALGRVSNLVLAPRTFLVLFTLAWLAYACGAFVTAHLRSRVTIVTVLAVSVLSRALLLPALPTLSTDAYRYVWDARVSSAGIDPYAYAPVAEPYNVAHRVPSCRAGVLSRGVSARARQRPRHEAGARHL